MSDFFWLSCPPFLSVSKLVRAHIRNRHPELVTSPIVVGREKNNLPPSLPPYSDPERKRKARH